MQDKTTPRIAAYFKILQGLEGSEGQVRAICDFEVRVCSFKNFLVMEKQIRVVSLKSDHDGDHQKSDQFRSTLVVVPWMSKKEAVDYGLDLEGEGYFAYPITMTGKSSAILSTRDVLKYNGKNVILPYRDDDVSNRTENGETGILALIGGEYRLRIRSFIGFTHGKLSGSPPCIIEAGIYAVADRYLSCGYAMTEPGVYMLTYDGVCHSVVKFKPGQLIHRGSAGLGAHVVQMPDATPEVIMEAARKYLEATMKNFPQLFVVNYPTNLFIKD